MKLASILLLLVVGSCCLFRGCAGGVIANKQQMLHDEHLQPCVPLEVEDEDHLKPETYIENLQKAIQPNCKLNIDAKPVPAAEEADQEEYIKPELEVEGKPESFNEDKQEDIAPISEEEHAQLEPNSEDEDNHVEPAPEDELEQSASELEVEGKPEPFNEDKQEDIAPISEEEHAQLEPNSEDEDNYVEPAPEDELIQPASVADQKPEGRASECKITIRGGLPTPQPVYLKEGSNEFYSYDNNGVMIIDSGEALEMWCPDKFTSIAKTLITARCVSGSNFKVDGTTYSIKELTCKSWPSFTAEKTGAYCNGGVMMRAGFKISSSRFVKQYEVCFNEGEEVTRYVHHELNPGSNYYQSGVDRLTFQTAGLFGGKNVDKLYTQASHQATITAQLGAGSDKYFNSNKNIFLARGHMAAKADFDYGTEQRATFLFINVAPQWQVFNAGNWARVEDGVRDKVSKSKWYVDCYTGVYGVTTLPNQNGVHTPLYLTYDQNNNGLIPVPKIYFRVVIERNSRKGIVFIGVNNPHLSLAEIKKDYVICNDISDKVDYINWKRTDITAGYSYACEVNDFKNKVTHLPALSAPGGLLL